MDQPQLSAAKRRASQGSVFQLEVCVDRVEDALAAVQAGATRIELNSALACSGLTPSLASCRWLVQHCAVPILAMLRPHDVGFAYTETEQELMLQDCELLLETGIQGIVSGALNQLGQIDSTFVSRLVETTGSREFVFHRAFDQLPDQYLGLEQLVACGVTRVLTSGGSPSALEGSERLRALVQTARERVEILPAAGINSTNVREIIERVGCTQIHGSFHRNALVEGNTEPGPDTEEIKTASNILRQLYRSASTGDSATSGANSQSQP